MRRIVALLVLCWSIGAPTQALAFVPRAGNMVIVSDPVRDDLYISGGTVQSIAPVDGDLAVVGGTVTVTGAVTGSVLAAGGTLTFGGAVGRTLRAAGGSLTITGRVASDAVVAGGNIEIGPNAEIGRDLVVAAGTMQVSGAVHRNALLSGGQVILSGTIQGDTEVRANGLIVLPTARLQGRLRYTAETPAEIHPGAQVVGGIERLPARVAQPRTDAFKSPYLRLFLGVLEALWLLALGLVAIALVPHRVRIVAEQIRTQFGISLLVGFILLVTVPVGAVLLFATIIGIPLSAIAMLLYFATLCPAMIFSAVWLGELVTTGWFRRPSASTSLYLALMIGVLILVILFALPWLGWIFRVLAVLVGFGAFWASVWNTRNRPPSALLRA